MRIQIASNAPECAVAPFAPQMFVNRCPTTSDGRPQHCYAKQNGTWTCRQCGESKA